ncbi:MAG: hypothetical protein JWM34_4597 [Ilumatobacteraceae bacterium]|nr:hypothetical protein [Ilumatobacteraceae bacterium]
MVDDAHDLVPLDHAVVERVIRRAVEIAGPILPDDPSSAAGISRAALVAAADEVGLPAVAVLRSIAAEHLGELPPRRLVDRIVGVAVVAVDDEIAGSADDVLARIDAWLVEGHHRRRDRVRNGRGDWSKRSGLVGLTMRKMRKATGEGGLSHYQHVAAVAEEIGTGSTAVRITVDRQGERNMAAAGGAVVVVGGIGGVAAAAAGPLVLVAAPFVVIGGVGVALTGRRRARRTAMEVERLLEAVADHHSPTRLRADVAQRVIGRRSSIGRGSSAD